MDYEAIKRVHLAVEKNRITMNLRGRFFFFLGGSGVRYKGKVKWVTKRN